MAHEVADTAMPGPLPEDDWQAKLCGGGTEHTLAAGLSGAAAPGIPGTACPLIREIARSLA